MDTCLHIKIFGRLLFRFVKILLRMKFLLNKETLYLMDDVWTFIDCHYWESYENISWASYLNIAPLSLPSIAFVQHFSPSCLFCFVYYCISSNQNKTRLHSITIWMNKWGMFTISIFYAAYIYIISLSS